VSEYRDIQSAVRAEKFKIWFAWFCGGFIMLGITIASKDIHILNVVTTALLVVLGVAFTIAAVRMTNALNRKVDKARKDILGDL
jgi:surface polysaccharide O-acyltransferase-like enzyme